MKVSELFEASKQNIVKKADSKKEILKKVNTIKNSDGAVKWKEIYSELENSSENDDEFDFMNRVVDELHAWSDDFKNKFNKLAGNLKKLEYSQKDKNGDSLYLFDESVINENILVDGRTEQSIDYWASAYKAACEFADSHAKEAGFNINTLLGYKIY